MHDEKRDGARHHVAKAGEEAEHQIEAEAELGARHPELVVHHARDEAHLGEALLMGKLRAVVAPELGGRLACPAAVGQSPTENLLRAAHRLLSSIPVAPYGGCSTHIKTWSGTRRPRLGFLDCGYGNHRPSALERERPRSGKTRSMASDSYDVLILGGGNAGFGVTVPTREAGLKVALVEERDLGGTCPNRGCTPKKVLVAAGHALHEINQAHVHGISVSKPKLDWAALIDREKEMISGIPDSLAETLQERGVDLFRDSANFVGRNAVQSW